MTDTELVEAIIKYKLWVHPAGGYDEGWTASGNERIYPDLFAWNRSTLHEAVVDALANYMKKRVNQGELDV